MHFVDEIPQHALGGFKIGNNAVHQRARRHDVRRCFADHGLGLIADRHDLIRARVHRHHRRLVDDNSLLPHIDQRVGRA